MMVESGTYAGFAACALQNVLQSSESSVTESEQLQGCCAHVKKAADKNTSSRKDWRMCVFIDIALIRSGYQSSAGCLCSLGQNARFGYWFLEVKAKKDNGSPARQPQIDYHLSHLKAGNRIINFL